MKPMISIAASIAAAAARGRVSIIRLSLNRATKAPNGGALQWALFHFPQCAFQVRRQLWRRTCLSILAPGDGKADIDIR
jgi:hypothetical protein